MHPFTSHYEMVREGIEERVARSMRRYRMSTSTVETASHEPASARDGDVIELVFGARCEVEDAIA